MWMRKFLIVTGIGAFVALTMPMVVVLASFLVIPGWILVSRPTVFMYGATFASIRIALSTFLSSIPQNLIAAAATLAIFFVIPLPGLFAARTALANATLPDLQPSQPIQFAGNILITRPFELGCDQLCAALLKTPGVASVRIATHDGKSSIYRIVPDTMAGERATAIGYGLLDEDQDGVADSSAARSALQAEWNLMLSDGKALVVSDDAPAPDFTIAIEDAPVATRETRDRRPNGWSLQPPPVDRKALSVSDRNRHILLRRSKTAILAPAVPLRIMPRGGVQNFEFGWHRTWLVKGETTLDIPINRLLLEHSNIAHGADMVAAAQNARDALVPALDDPKRHADDPAFALANQWMNSFRQGRRFDDSDRPLLARIIADERVGSTDGLWVIIRQIEDDASDLRAAAARRFLAADDKVKAAYWVDAFTSLPDGAYARSLPEEREILADAAASRYVTGLIERQGDRGPAAAPDLLRLLREFSHADAANNHARDIVHAESIVKAMNAVRRGLRRIGPSAAFIRPELETLLASPGMQNSYGGDNRQLWDALLVTLGRAPDTLRTPEEYDSNRVAYSEKVAELAARGYEWGRD